MPNEPRCRECGHPESDHENGRCLHWSVTTQRGDPICGCLGWVDPLALEPIRTQVLKPIKP